MNKFNKILVIDDDVTANFLTEKIIKFLDVSDNIEFFLNGKPALDQILRDCLREKAPQRLILLDMEMPVMDGVQFLKAFSKLKIDKANIHIALLTTTSPNSAKIKTIKAMGLKYFIDKPLEITKLKILCEKIWEENPQKFLYLD